MPQGLQAVLALVVLLPGFVSARIVRMMSAKSQQSELERIIEALIFSFFIYVIYVFIWNDRLPLEWGLQSRVSSSALYGVSVFRWRLISLVAIAIALGVGWGYVKGHHLLVLLMRRWKLTHRSSRESVWFDVFMTFGGFVQVSLGDGRNVMGWVKQYSEPGEERTLFLERACWIIEGAEPVDVPGDGMVLLTKKSEIRSVMFLDKGKQR